MLNSKVEEILNAQINKEFHSAYLYLAMSAYFDGMGLKGFANWTKVQAKEEMDHGMILFNYILERDGKIDLGTIESPTTDFYNPQQVLEMILEHEKTISCNIESITYLTEEECDCTTRHFINWYIREQAEEEATIADIIKKIKLFGTEPIILYHMDNELMKREYTKHDYTE